MSLASSIFSPALASPAATLPYRLSDAAAFQLSLLLTRLLPFPGSGPSSSPFFLARRPVQAGPGLGPAGLDAGR